jgi:hypothetical protein
MRVKSQQILIVGLLVITIVIVSFNIQITSKIEITAKDEYMKDFMTNDNTSLTRTFSVSTTTMGKNSSSNTRIDSTRSTPASFDDLQLMNLSSIPTPTNLNILMIADSLTRYQYLNLVYFLTYQTWVQNDQRPNMVLEKTHESWIDFYNFTHTTLQPNEYLCDCYRQDKKEHEAFRGKLIQTTVENRYFHDPIRNNTVVYLQKFGANSFHSNYHVNECSPTTTNTNTGNSATKNALLTNEKALHYEFDSANWTTIIKDYICLLPSKPNIVIFNQGLWGPSSLDDPKIQNEITSSLNQCNIQSMYKTTTKMKGKHDGKGEKVDIDMYEQELCFKTDYCFDLSWTGLLPDNMYWDRAHFQPIVYSWMNALLLDKLISIQTSRQ